jgi:hypothetical protein
MSRYIPDTIRQLVAQRAGHRCEYCRIHQEDFYFQFEIDHVVSLKHEGETSLENLALACGICNRSKGSELGTYLDGKKEFVRLFDPRTDDWYEHFELDEGEIIAKSLIGRATIKILDFNNPDRIILRQVLMAAGRYP